SIGAAHDRRTGHEVFHDGAENCRLELLPFTSALGDRDEIGAEEHTRDSRNAKQALGQRRLGGRLLVAHVERAARQHGASGQELERCWIRGGFGLNEHGLFFPAAGQKCSSGHCNRWRVQAEVQPIPRLGGGFKERRPDEAFRSGPQGEWWTRAQRAYDIASSSSSLRWPGT